MSKWVEVPITIHKTFAVEIEDTETVDDAIKYALNECLGDNTEIGDCLMADNNQTAEQIQRLADERLSI